MSFKDLFGTRFRPLDSFSLFLGRLFMESFGVASWSYSSEASSQKEDFSFIYFLRFGPASK